MSDPAAPVPRELDAAALTALAEGALFRSGERGATVTGLRPLDGGSDRNAVARAVVERASGPRSSVVVKAARTVDPDPGAPDPLRRSGFAREWTALALIDRRSRARAGPGRLVGADVGAEAMVLRDLGEGAVTLVGALTGGGAAAAERAVVDLATALGRLHAATADCAEEHARLAAEAFPGARRPGTPQSSLPGFEWCADRLASRLGGEVPREELAALALSRDAPGRWTVLTHGDPCPDNALRVGDGVAGGPGPGGGSVELVDFEFARPGHALDDATWWRMGFPSCWCAGVVPAATVARADAAYREILTAAVPEATDGAAWADGLARACARQLLQSAPRVLDGALGDDEPWGTARCRERLLHWLRACADALDAPAARDARTALSGLRRAIDVWTASVEGLDGGRGSLAPYPPFAAVPGNSSARLAMAVVVRDGLVLVQRRRRRGAGFVHEFPGGRAEPGETSAGAAARELLEETGLAESVVVHEGEAPSRDGGTVAFVVFDSRSDAAPRRTSEARRQTFLWLAPDEIPIDDLAPADARFVRDELPSLLRSVRPATVRERGSEDP